MLLLSIGLLIIYAIGPQRANFMNSAYGVNYDTNYFFIHQAVSVGLSIAAFMVAMKVPYRKVFGWARAMMIAALVLCLMMAVMAFLQHGESGGIVTCALGGCRWFNLGGFSFQPAELLKISMILYLATLISKHKQEGTFETKEFFVPLLIVAGAALAFVVVAQKDMGTGVVMIAIILAMLWASGMQTKYFGVVFGVLLVGGLLAVITSPHRMDRVRTYLSGQEADADSSYHIDNAMLAIGTGGLFGVGLGNSVQATGYLPESINDSVFAIMGETFGFLGLTVILLAFLILLTNILRVAGEVDEEEELIATGVFAWIGTHVVVNIAAMTGLIPLTGITLPLLSYGGTSMIFIAYAVGMVGQMSCYTRRKTKAEGVYRRRKV